MKPPLPNFCGVVWTGPQDLALACKNFLVFLNINPVGARKSPLSRGRSTTFSTSRSSHHLVWRAHSGVYSFDHSFLRSFVASSVRAFGSSFPCLFERLFLHMFLPSFLLLLRYSFLCLFIVCLFICLPYDLTQM